MKKIIQSALMIGLLSVSLTSCLKDKENEAGKIGLQDPEKSGIKIVEILNADHGPIVYALNTAPAIEKVPVITVNLATGKTASEDIKVTLVKNLTMISDYNTVNSTSYVELPANCYTLPTDGLTVTIPKGSNSASLDLSLIKGNFDFTKAYAVAYSIGSVSPSGYTISGNFNKLMSVIGLKNKYDGLYSARIFQSGWAAYGISDGVTNVYPTSIAFITAGAGKCTTFGNSTGSNLLPGFTSAGALTQFGATAPEYTFDPATDKLVSVRNTIPDDGRGRFLVIEPTITTSRYDPVTKKIYAAYYMTQIGRPNQNYRDTLTYIGPR